MEGKTTLLPHNVPVYQQLCDMTKAEMADALMLIDTRRMSFDMREIENRRFMFSPQTGELILGKQYKGRQLYKSHAEEHFDSGAKAPFDSFIRGWIGTGKDYKNGVIHFAPNISADNIPAFDKAFSTLQMFSENGANGNTVVRGFGGAWEQPLNNIITQNPPALAVGSVKKTLFVMTGVPGSGKSTKAEAMVAERPKAVIVSSDNIREELFGNASIVKDNARVFGLLDNRARDYLAQGYDVFYDTCGLSKKNRMGIIRKFKDDADSFVSVFVDTPLDVCKARNRTRTRQVPEAVIDRFWDFLQVPTTEEGFDECIVEAYKG